MLNAIPMSVNQAKNLIKSFFSITLNNHYLYSKREY